MSTGTLFGKEAETSGLLLMSRGQREGLLGSGSIIYGHERGVQKRGAGGEGGREGE